MLTKHIPSVIAVTLAVLFGSATARADTLENERSSAKLSIKPAVLTTSADQQGTPVTEVQWRRGYRRGWYGYPYYGYRYRPYYSYYRPYYGGYSYYRPYYSGYSYYRPYYGGYYYPRYYTGYRGFSIYGPRFSGSFYW